MILTFHRYVDAMSSAGATQLIFQWEAIDNFEDAKVLSRAIKDSGMRCGVSLNPETNVEEIYPLLKSGLVDTVDILAVEPGEHSIFSFQISFRHEALLITH